MGHTCNARVKKLVFQNILKNNKMNVMVVHDAFKLLFAIAKRSNQPMKVRKKGRTKSNTIDLPCKDLRSPSKD